MNEYSKLLINETPMAVLPSLVGLLGFEKAVLMQQVQYLIQSPGNGKTIDGKKYIWNTAKQFSENLFPFWQPRTIAKHLRELEKANLLISIQPLAAEWNRTKFYRINYEKLNSLQCLSNVYDDEHSMVYDDTPSEVHSDAPSEVHSDAPSLIGTKNSYKEKEQREREGAEAAPTPAPAQERENENPTETNQASFANSGIEAEATARPAATVADQVFDYWVSVCVVNKSTAVFNKKRKAAVNGVLKEGYSLDTIKEAIDGCNITPHNNGHNDTGAFFKDLELICRNGSNIERFQNNWLNKNSITPDKDKKEPAVYRHPSNHPTYRKTARDYIREVNESMEADLRTAQKRAEANH